MPFVCNRISFIYASSATVFSYAVARRAIMWFWAREFGSAKAGVSGQLQSRSRNSGKLSIDVVQKQPGFCIISQNVFTTAFAGNLLLGSWFSSRPSLVLEMRNSETKINRPTKYKGRTYVLL
jgi:hypothetical protein